MDWRDRRVQRASREKAEKSGSCHRLPGVWSVRLPENRAAPLAFRRGRLTVPVGWLWRENTSEPQNWACPTARCAVPERGGRVRDAAAALEELKCWTVPGEIPHPCNTGRNLGFDPQFTDGPGGIQAVRLAFLGRRSESEGPCGCAASIRRFALERMAR